MVTDLEIRFKFFQTMQKCTLKRYVTYGQSWAVINYKVINYVSNYIFVKNVFMTTFLCN